MIKMSIPNELVQEIKGILQKTIASLKNLEGHLNVRTEEIKNFNGNLGKFENNLIKELKKISDSLPKTEKKVVKKIGEIALKTEKLTALLKGYKDAFQSLSDESQPTFGHDINSLLYDVVRLEEIDFSQPIIVSRAVTSSSAAKVSAGTTSGITAKAAKIQSQLSGISQASASSDEGGGVKIVDPNKWTDSEIEGFGVFDELITGWKLRDFEKLKGTREMFAIGWRKLNDHDRKKIRNGAWSEPIIKKLVLLGRSRFEDD